MKLVPTIISGGSGSRLWPVSRELHPKPFIRLPDGLSLIQHAFRRATHLPEVSRLVTVTNRELMFKTADEYGEVNQDGIALTFLLEPMGRDTAAAVAVAALHVAASEGDDAIMLVLPSDHLIADEAAFGAAVARAAALAAQGRLVTFGITPDKPETGFGYIEANGTEVARFVEKPDAETAAQYLASGRFLWNSGMFCFAAGTMVRLLARHAPDILASTRAALDAAQTSTGPGRLNVEIDAAAFAQVPATSIDYAILEKAADVAVVPCDIGWSDIGSWNALAELVEPDASGNRVHGSAVLEKSSNSYVHGDGRLIGLVGVSDLVVVDSDDALLVAHKDSVQDVKTLYARLKSQGHEAYSLHRTVHRPWGAYTILEEGERFKIKRIEVKPGASLSLQMHHHRSEHWVVVSGTAKVVNGDQTLLLSTNQGTYIPLGTLHRLENPGKLRLVMIEVQSGDYLGEDDIVRIDDIYGRTPG